MISRATDILGLGLYTPREAAMYARVKTQLINRWVFGGSGEPVVRAQIGEVGEQRIVSFLDFIQTLAIRAIRVQFNVPLSKIREAFDTARTEYGVEYPFALRHNTILFGNTSDPKSCNVVIELPGRGESARLVQLTGKRKKNQIIREVMETYHCDLTYRDDGLVSEYRPLTDGGVSIALNPEISFGEPVVGETGYTAYALYESFKAEGSIKGAASVYGVKESEVQLACKYFDYLTGSIAA
jgi:uncharacterized protein (DUF433 family)